MANAHDLLMSQRAAMMGGLVNPYQTADNALIAMWDGEWNAGIGVHKDELEYWEDLISGLRAIPTQSTASFGDKYLHLTKPNRLSCTDDLIRSAISGSEFSCEVCCQFNTYRQPDCVFSINGKGRPLWIFQQSNNYGVSFRQAGGETVVYQNTQAKNTISISNGKVYVNADFKTDKGSGYAVYSGNLLSIGGMDYSGYSGIPDANVYCIRLYNRALTSDEVSAKYAIDKARFNIPDAA